jgi:hemerythrin-like domain-containing protein
MKRHPALAKLSREHHFALVLAKRAESVDEGESLAGLASETADAFAREIAPHFLIEERILLPALEEAGQKDHAARTLEEHDALRKLADRLVIGGMDVLRAFGELLERHVRFEERELFPLIESALTQEMLEKIALERGAESRKQ